MIALYQLFSGTSLARFPQEVQDLVHAAGSKVLPSVRRAVIVGRRLSPGQPTVKADGTEMRTMWGELAWQLGGAEAFALVAGADRTGTNPGDALRVVLEQAGPCLILIDEWLAYARALYSDDSSAGGTFDTHFSFAQMLTEAARARRMRWWLFPSPLRRRSRAQTVVLGSGRVAQGLVRGSRSEVQAAERHSSGSVQ